MRRRSLLVIPVMPTLMLAGCGNSPIEPLDDFTIMRQATDQYQDLQVALGDGFIELSPCVASPAGGMGFHYGHPARIEDAVIDPALPEILLYEPGPGGGLRLVGVEFMVHQDAWQAAGNHAPPAVAGQTFDSPDPNHPDEQLRDFYTLHAWVWKDNPGGVFAPFNPAVHCE
jgi:hypothetical protein